jgi:integration host factor subunit beta
MRPPPQAASKDSQQQTAGRIGVDGERSMTKSELIELIAAKQSHLPAKDVELAVKQILEIMSDALAQGQRIEIRGFGSFSLHFRPPRQGRNPKTGETVALAGKYVPHFKPGKDLRERVNEPLDEPRGGEHRSSGSSLAAG